MNRTLKKTIKPKISSIRIPDDSIKPLYSNSRVERLFSWMMRLVKRKSAPRNTQRSQPKRRPVGKVRLHQATPQPGFDFSFAMRKLACDMIERTPELAHIEMKQVAVAIVQARADTSHGIFASLTPMRFKQGSKQTLRRGRQYTVQMLYDEHGREMLYILSFYLPRFMNLDFSEKLITIFHELWHISPSFDGDIRRHPGRCYAHSSSQKEYDAHMAVLSNRYLMQNPPRSLYQFLEDDFSELYQKHGSIYGVKLPRPKLIPAAG